MAAITPQEQLMVENALQARVVERALASIPVRLQKVVGTDDLTQSGRVGIITAVRSYNAARLPFEEWAKIKCEAAMLCCIRKVAKQHKREIAGLLATNEVLGLSSAEFDGLRTGADEARITLDNLTHAMIIAALVAMCECDADAGDDAEEWAKAGDALAEAVRALPPRPREIIRMVYREGMTFVAVAAALGIDESTVRRNHWRAIERLRVFLAKAGVVDIPERAAVEDSHGSW